MVSIISMLYFHAAINYKENKGSFLFLSLKYRFYFIVYVLYLKPQTKSERTKQPSDCCCGQFRRYLITICKPSLFFNTAQLFFLRKHNTPHHPPVHHPLASDTSILTWEGTYLILFEGGKRRCSGWLCCTKVIDGYERSLVGYNKQQEQQHKTESVCFGPNK